MKILTIILTLSLLVVGCRESSEIQNSKGTRIGEERRKRENFPIRPQMLDEFIGRPIEDFKEMFGEADSVDLFMGEVRLNYESEFSDYERIQPGGIVGYSIFVGKDETFARWTGVYRGL